MARREPNTDTLANNLATRIRTDIAERGLREGELFMTGEELAAHYGVSRGIAREAISQLRALGVLKSRQRKGLIVARSDLVGLFERGLPFYGTMPEDLRALAQLRYVLEVGSVDLAVTNASDRQIQELAGLAREYRRQVDASAGGEPGSNETEMAFHGLILEMTGNPLISGMHTVLSDYFQKSAERNPHPTFTDAENRAYAWEHEAIAMAFRERDPEATRAYLRKHLRNLVDEQSFDNGYETRASRGAGMHMAGEE